MSRMSAQPHDLILLNQTIKRYPKHDGSDPNLHFIDMLHKNEENAE